VGLYYLDEVCIFIYNQRVWCLFFIHVGLYLLDNVCTLLYTISGFPLLRSCVYHIQYDSRID